MTMTIDHQRQFGGMTFDHYQTPSQFSNPWSATSGPAPTNSIYAPSGALSPSLALDHISKQQHQHQHQQQQQQQQQHQQHQQQQQQQRTPQVKNEYVPYNTVPITAASGSSLLTDGYGRQELLTMPQDLMGANRMQTTTASYVNDTAAYTSAPSPAHSTYTTSAPYESMGYVSAPVRSTFALPQQQVDSQRRLSQPSLINSNDARSFGDAIDASRGMIAMSQNTTPRNIYRPNATTGRSNRDSYGFPATHSSNSSISSSSYQTPSSYFSGSVESSVSDYSNAGSDIEPATFRTLPRPNGLINGGIPPAPQSMMGQFSSKISSSTQKKHKCKVCDKRFTRPSSLQTHMYSHTGEKPFSCEVEGCGRHFSVVSNLRRHRKVHKGEARSEAGSEDRQSMEED